MERCSGVLAPVSALPSQFGIGDFGDSSYRFVDLLEQGGFRLWQLLPLNPSGYGHSPYQPFSSFAIDELFMDVAAIGISEKMAYLVGDDINPDRVDYEKIARLKHALLFEAFLREKEGAADRMSSFVASHPWVKPWSLFMMLKRKNKLRPWSEWPLEEQQLIETKEPSLNRKDRTDCDYEVWVQMTLYGQWGKLKEYAKSKGIRLIGDVPFYVGFDSCDVWANQECFLLDEKTKQPSFVAGVPPDYFSATGQRWGNPIYDWATLEKHNFAFLIDRLKGSGELFDIIRLDHFRAFDTYWKIPTSSPTAEEGEWVEAPGYRFFEILSKQLMGIEIIAEDLGELRPEVYALRDHCGFPGMNVVEFTFQRAEIEKTMDADRENMVVYIGTHDNDPFNGFWTKMGEDEQTKWLDALDSLGIEGQNPLERIINYTLGLSAKYAILTPQDILGLGSETRWNVPSIINEMNWTWRLRDYRQFEAMMESYPLLTNGTIVNPTATAAGGMKSSYL